MPTRKTKSPVAVKLEVCLSGPTFYARPGQIILASPEEAERLISRGLATHVLEKDMPDLATLPRLGETREKMEAIEKRAASKRAAQAKRNAIDRFETNEQRRTA